MASGLEEHQACLRAVSTLGRERSRRARSGCELGEEGGKLVAEGTPLFEEPSVERDLLACPRCLDRMDGGLPRTEPHPLRFLAASAWSELLAAQLVSVRMVRAMVGEALPWAWEASEIIWLDEGIEALA